MAHRRPELAAAAPPPLEDVVRAWAPDLGRHLDTLGLEDAAAAYAAALPENRPPPPVPAGVAAARVMRLSCDAALAAARAAGGPDGLPLAAALRDDARARDAAGDFRGAVESLERAHAIFEARREPFEAWGRLDAPAMAQRFAEEALAVFEALPGDMGPSGRREHAHALAALGVACFQRGDAAAAAAALEMAVDVFGACGDPDHWNATDRGDGGGHDLALAVALTNLANARGALGEFEQKKALLLHALRIKRARFEHDKDHPEIATTLANLGNACAALGDHAAAQRHMARALAGFEKWHGPDHFTVLATLMNLGACCAASGDDAGAGLHLRRAAHVGAALHPETAAEWAGCLEASRLDDSKLELEEPESPGVRDFEVEAPEAPQSRPDSPMDEDDLL
ncbi:hypothetical protein AURANDRAFT_65139 [Aureococcus anophagefferens]|uniref:MalT-like TPR region domain-containing protein n=1 Tax=Aureococcus anophagefferens TaxID=44056 RepID=F0YCU4_AURAN|nr:hypothetical protein AURANDRAFT_65139 [Aureococcus anophagefferens]EGB07118.1 hypothetical protein AURANDRAFT_65139 [Aureococcus anophagefferens]|eukprot:XP_009038348.1 hypothetical protein AURANDRAFT_65139 [Aureococcus anophagefferens]